MATLSVWQSNVEKCFPSHHKEVSYSEFKTEWSADSGAAIKASDDVYFIKDVDIKDFQDTVGD